MSLPHLSAAATRELGREQSSIGILAVGALPPCEYGLQADATRDKLEAYATIARN
jgi:hypothetical protein